MSLSAKLVTDKSTIFAVKYSSMDHLEVFDSSNIFIAGYFTSDCECVSCNREHTLIYICSGELEISEQGRTTILRPGECAFMRRDNCMRLYKRVKDGVPYHSIVMKFSRNYLREMYQTLKSSDLPKGAKRDNQSVYVLPADRYDIRFLFESLKPYFDAKTKPSDEELKLKMAEGVYAILNTDANLYASLFDFVDPWKIDIIDFMDKNYMHELSMADVAYYTGRSLATFKRDFKQYSDMTPQKWLMRRRLQAANEFILAGGKTISEICFSVGFKNLSHFSKVYKEAFGVAPTNVQVPTCLTNESNNDLSIWKLTE